MIDDPSAVARRALPLLDLTNLNDDCTADDIGDLISRARTPFGPVAAVCIWPRFVEQAAKALGNTPIRIATVVNFPSGNETASEVIAMTEQAVADGADEIDMVVPWAALLEGHPENISARVARVRRASEGRTLKAIIESGMLREASLIDEAARGAIDGGADFVKTSTGKVPTNATPEAARTILEAIKDLNRPVGFKAAGGIRNVSDASVYLDIADEIMGPDWAAPATFRFGASSVLDALIAAIEGRKGTENGNGY